MGMIKCEICGSWSGDHIALQIHKMTCDKQPDPTNPDHYKAGGMEVIDILRAKLTPEQFEGFLMGNVIKYTFRCKMKNGAEDLKKAAWYSSMLAGVDPRK